MRAVHLTGHGDLDRLEYRDDVPTPVAGPGEVLVRVRAATVNNTDIATRQAWYAKAQGEDRPSIETFSKRTIAFPRIQGAGGAGIVEAVGDGVGQDRIGQVVLVDPFLRDLSQPAAAQLSTFMGSGLDGCFADYVVVPDDNAVSVDAEMSFAELACLPVSYQTAEEMQLRAQITEGAKVLITGASGGVGAANVQLAKMRGAVVLAVAGAAKHDALRELGADHVIDRDADVAAATERLWGERQVDVVLDVVGGAAFARLLHCLKRGGHLVSAGAVAGPLAQIDLRTTIYRDISISGVGSAQRETLRRLASHAEAKALRPSISRIFALKELRTAQAEFLERNHVGKIVIDVHDASASATQKRECHDRA